MIDEATTITNPAEDAAAVGPCEYCGFVKPLLVDARLCGSRCARLDRGNEDTWRRNAERGWSA